jgi:uncharacterized membrane protein YvbJ
LKEKPRFFCDNCGQEVGDSIKTCPYCGRYFASVRCPACGFSGDDKLFGNGCPSCGYSASPSSAPKIAKKPKTKRSRVKKKPPPADPLPVFFYIVSGIVLLVVLAMLSYLITR